jgi:hypothetical protein
MTSIKLSMCGTFALVALGACTDTAGTAASLPTGNAALGISSFRVTETPRSIEVAGLDESQQTIGRIYVQTGPFTIAKDYAEDGIARDVDGRKIVMEYRSTRLDHQSEGYLPLNLPLVTMEQYALLNAFLIDPHLTVALDKWDVHFQGAKAALASNGEAAYVYSGGPFCGSYAESNYASCGTNFTPPCSSPAYQQPSGADLNQCNRNIDGSVILGPAATVSNYWGTGYTMLGDGWITSLTQFCQNGVFYPNQKWGAVKSCCTAVNCNTGCGPGGDAGCHACYGVMQNLSTTQAYCFGNGTGSCTFWGGGTTPPSTGCASGGWGSASYYYYAN